MQAFEAAYRRHFPAVYRFALSLVRRHDVAEDLTAEAFLELGRQGERVDLDQLPAWLFVVVRNRARDRWRRQLVEQRYARWLERPASASGPSAVRWLLDGGLKPVQRVCLELHYVWGYTVEEVAARLGLSAGQVKGQVQRALRHLREAEGRPLVSEPTNPFDPAFDASLREDAARARDARGDCPPPDVVMAHASEALEDVRDRVAAHLRVCEACRRLAADADALDDGIPDGAEERVFSRVSARVEGTFARPWLVAAGVLLACGAAAAWWFQPADRRAASALVASAPAASAPAGAHAPAPAVAAVLTPLWTVNPATVRVPLSALGVSRGSDADRAAVRALLAALQPYERGDYKAAIQGLEPYVRDHPDAADGAFYLGVAHLMADQPAAAIGPLSQARELRDDRGRREVDWFLAAAEQRTGRAAEARSRLEALCRTGGAYQQSACAAAATLR